MRIADSEGRWSRIGGNTALAVAVKQANHERNAAKRKVGEATTSGEMCELLCSQEAGSRQYNVPELVGK
jgi:hypothetical protein